MAGAGNGEDGIHGTQGRVGYLYPIPRLFDDDFDRTFCPAINNHFAIIFWKRAHQFENVMIHNHSVSDFCQRREAVGETNIPEMIMFFENGDHVSQK